MSRAARIWFGVATAGGAIVTFLLVFVRTDVATFRARSESMAPTLDVGDRIAANEEAYDDAGPEVGDIVVFHPPAGVTEGARCGAPVGPRELCPEPVDEAADVTFVFRIVAGPGDRLRVRDGRAIVDGEPLDEPYARLCTGDGETCTFRGEVTIPPDHYFVMGDNRAASSDSRFWGPVPRDRIVGRVDDCTLLGLWCSGKKG